MSIILKISWSRGYSHYHSHTPVPAKLFQPSQPEPGLINTLTLAYTFSKQVLLLLFEAQCPRLDPVLTSPVCQDHLKL